MPKPSKFAFLLLAAVALCATAAHAAEQTPEDRFTAALAKLPDAMNAMQRAAQQTARTAMRVGATEDRNCLKKTIAHMEQHVVNLRIVSSYITLGEFSRLRRSDPDEAHRLAREILDEWLGYEKWFAENLVTPEQCLYGDRGNG